MNVVVTGSSGYLGSLLLPRLAASSHVTRLVGIDVRPPAAPPARFEHQPGSVLDPDLADRLAAAGAEVVVHLAWLFNPTHDREQMRRIDVDGTVRVVEAAARAGVRHLIHLSSTTAYGAHPDNPPLLRESDPPRGNPDFPYAADKAAVERELDRLEPLHPRLGITRLRPCIVLGRKTDNFVRALLELPALLRVSGADPPMQFLHEDDLAACLALLVERRPQGAFNLCPPDAVRLSELARLLGIPSPGLPAPLLRAALALAWRLRLIGVPASYLAFVRWPWLADGSRLASEVGFVPRYGSRDAAREFADRRRGRAS